MRGSIVNVRNIQDLKTIALKGRKKTALTISARVNASLRHSWT